jgi:DNA-binding response OmpR family regulator
MAAQQEDPLKSHVLVVEDDKSLNKLICRCVDLAGYTSRAALDGTSALREIESRLPSLILLDLMLPDITGFDICRQVKTDTRTSHIPVIMLTALDDAANREQGLHLGATEYLTKPFKPNVLIETIQHLAMRFGIPNSLSSPAQNLY